MRKGLFRDAASAAHCAKILDIVHSAEEVLVHLQRNAEVGRYGGGLWADALVYDLMSCRARLEHIRQLMGGLCDDLPPQ